MFVIHHVVFTLILRPINPFIYTNCVHLRANLHSGAEYGWTVPLRVPILSIEQPKFIKKCRTNVGIIQIKCGRLVELREHFPTV